MSDAAPGEREKPGACLSRLASSAKEMTVGSGTSAEFSPAPPQASHRRGARAADPDKGICGMV